MNKQKLPEGYSPEQLRLIAGYYENQTDEQSESEIEAAFADPETVFVQVPVDLAPRLQSLIEAASRG